ncbi:MAG: hypothetical protein IKL62_07215 [Clostridia bacterium]|nr:hypothetical protein [Clostridia bacterium]
MFVFDEKWQRYDGKIYSEKCQKRLTELYKIRKKYYKESAFDLVNKAHEAIKRKDLSVAVSYFEIATVVSFRHEIREFMAELSSLYRNFGKPNASIELYKYIKYKHSDFSFPSDFLTSLAAAYLDIGKKEEALRLADRIYGRQKGLPDEKLKKLYNRTDSY